jgi:hypothetical protein
MTTTKTMTGNERARIDKTLERRLGSAGRLISGSKGSYRYSHPAHVVVFNANIVVEGHGKVWHGDVDLSLPESEEALLELARAVGGKRVHLLYESDARFENESAPRTDHAVWTGHLDETTGAVRVVVNERVYVRDSAGRLVIKGESPDEVIAREARRAAEDRASMTEEDLLPLRIPFPYELVAASAKTRRRKEAPPMVVFIQAVVAAAEALKIENAHLSAVIHAEDEEILLRASERRIRREHPYLGEYRLEKELSWLSFQYGPQSFVKDGTPDCIKKGEVRLRRPK